MKNRRNISDAAESAGERDLQEKIDAFCLMDDKFMRKCLEKARASVQYIVRALLDDDSLVVREFSTQRTVANLQGRGATLDIYAVDGRGREIDIEIQNDLSDADARRARWYSALLDANSLKAGEDPRSLRETYVIFITRGDYFGEGKELREFVRIDKFDGKCLGDGTFQDACESGETIQNDKRREKGNERSSRKNVRGGAYGRQARRQARG